MTAPAISFYNVATNLAVTAVDDPAERLVLATGTALTADNLNPMDFGTVDITSGPAKSIVKMVFGKITNWNSNTTVTDFRLYLPASGFGFDQTDSHIYAVSLNFDDTTGTQDNQALYVQNATYNDYDDAGESFIVPDGEPSAQNVWAADDTDSIIEGSDDVIALAFYLNIAASETTGTYLGDTTNYEARLALRLSYS